jgi:hypothetical protein
MESTTISASSKTCLLLSMLTKLSYLGMLDIFIFHYVTSILPATRSLLVSCSKKISLTLCE